jgi:beta-N-acetylhexosaminidase
LDGRISPVERLSEPGASPKLPADLRERIGQMIMVGFRGLTASEAEPVVRRIAEGTIGAVVMYDVDSETGGTRNIQSREQLGDLIRDLKAAGRIAPLAAIDAEGGFYHRLKEKYGFPPATPAADMGEHADMAYTRSQSSVIAGMLADVGMDLNLAPVLDLLNPANLTVSARRRNFSQDPVAVAAHAREFIKAHHERGVLCAGKHFPGMGGVLRPYSPGRGEIVDHWTEAELEPYRALIGEGLLDAVLAARVTHAELDAEYPGCLSKKIVDGLLRRKLGFDGMVISDAMEMLAVWDVFGFERGTILAVNAGVDMLLYCNQSGMVPYSDERPEEAIAIIAAAVERGEIEEARIDQACERVLRLKSRLKPRPQ